VGSILADRASGLATFEARSDVFDDTGGWNEGMTR
jgi:hypothetical protein